MLQVRSENDNKYSSMIIIIHKRIDKRRMLWNALNLLIFYQTNRKDLISQLETCGFLLMGKKLPEKILFIAPVREDSIDCEPLGKRDEFWLFSRRDDIILRHWHFYFDWNGPFVKKCWHFYAEDISDFQLMTFNLRIFLFVQIIP